MHFIVKILIGVDSPQYVFFFIIAMSPPLFLCFMIEVTSCPRNPVAFFALIEIDVDDGCDSVY